MQVLRGKNGNYLHHDTGKQEPTSIKSYIKKGYSLCDTQTKKNGNKKTESTGNGYLRKKMAVFKYKTCLSPKISSGKTR